MKFFIIQFSPITRYFSPLSPNYFYQHPVLKHPQTPFPLREKTSIQKCGKTRYNFVSCVTSYKVVSFTETNCESPPNYELEDHHLSTLRDCLFNIFAATHNIRSSFISPVNWGRATPWWQATHLTLLWRRWMTISRYY